jgi:ribosomal protein S18 acetylase RimI-like enzyme
VAAVSKAPVEHSVERIEEISEIDLSDLCDTTEAAIIDGGGFGWLTPPSRKVLERYWKGVLLIPERSLFVARLNGTIVGSAQLMRPPRNNEAQAFVAAITTNFIAPFARGHGLAREITIAVERAAREDGFTHLRLDVRETQTAAIQLYESLGYEHWGTNPDYAIVEGKMIAGRHYTKRLIGDLPDTEREATP